MYTFIIIFAVVFAFGMYFVLKKNSTEPEITPSESVSEEPIAVEEPIVVVENEVVSVSPTKKTNRRRSTRKKTTAPPKAKQAKNTKE
jgi:hypothetical protein